MTTTPWACNGSNSGNRRALLVVVTCMLLAAQSGRGGAQMQSAASPGPAAEVQRSYNGLKANILQAAQAMPAENYTFRPTPEVRTFARVVNHVTEAQGHSCGALLGPSAGTPLQVPEETASKDAIVQALQQSFSLCDRAMAAANSGADLTEMLPVGSAGKRSRIGLLWGTVSHDNEQYATLALYMRLKGLKPPSSER